MLSRVFAGGKYARLNISALAPLWRAHREGTLLIQKLLPNHRNARFDLHSLIHTKSHSNSSCERTM